MTPKRRATHSKNEDEISGPPIGSLRLRVTGGSAGRQLEPGLFGGADEGACLFDQFCATLHELVVNIDEDVYLTDVPLFKE